MRIRSVVSFLLVFWAISVFAQTNSATSAVAAVVPTLVRFSGALSETNATVGVTFALYKDQTAGAPLWLETQNVALDSHGRYTVNLGTNHAGGIPAELFAAGEARWLGVQPEGQAEQPRVLLVSVPYAMKAADADTLGGLPASAYVTADQLSVASPAAGGPGPALENGRAADSDVTPSPCTAVTSDGTALANYLTKFTAPCNLENSGIYQSALATTPGFLGIGTTAPVAPLDMEPAAQTGTSGGLFGVHVIANFNPTGNSTGNYYAFYGQSNSSMGNATNFTGDLVGSGFLAQHYGTGTVSNLFGANYSVQNRSTGTVTNAVGFYGGVSNLGAGTITNGYGLQVPVPQNSGGGVFTNFYGVYIANPTGITNSWGLYSLANTNYLSGKLGINVMAPTQALEINGNLKFDTTGHGITYADGTVQTTASLPGSGTITKVTAGTDLTGGGSSGAVTLNMDTTKVPTLAATTNTFTGTGGIHAVAFTGDGTNVTNVNAAELGGVAASGYPQLATFNSFTAAQNITGMGSGYILEAINNFTGSGSSAIYATSAGANAVGVYGEADNGTGAYGVEGISTAGTGVYGKGATGGSFAGSNTAVNAIGNNDSTGGAGAAGGEFTGGTELGSTGDGGYGLIGLGGTGSGLSTYGGIGGMFTGGFEDGDFAAGDGVHAVGGGDSGSGVPGYGIYAEGGSDMFGTNFAGYFMGDINVTGAITAGTKDFKIDHPLDPANKYLYHASVESSEMMNIYTGNVVLDGKGAAQVQLPDWFEAENADFRYALTAIGAPGPNLYISQKVTGGRFGIAGGQAHAEVSWQITAVRQDAFAKAHPLQVEVEKPEWERGLYIHPELYGAPREKQVAWSHLRQPRHLNPPPHPVVPVKPMPRQNQHPRAVAQNVAAPVAEQSR